MMDSSEISQCIPTKYIKITGEQNIYEHIYQVFKSNWWNFAKCYYLWEGLGADQNASVNTHIKDTLGA